MASDLSEIVGVEIPDEAVAVASNPKGEVAYRGRNGCQGWECTRDGHPERCYGWHCAFCHGPSNCQADCISPTCPASDEPQATEDR